MELQLEFGSPSANLGVMTNLPAGIFINRGKLISSKKPGKHDAASTRKRTGPTPRENVHLEFEDVVKRLKRGEHLTPHDVVAAFNLGWAFKTLGRWAESAKAYTKTIEFLDQDESKYRNLNLSTAYYLRGYAYASLTLKQKGEEARQNFEKAERDYLEAIKLKKDLVLVYCYLGVLYGMQGRWVEAERAFKKAIRLKPRYAGAHHDLGAIYAQSGRPKLALKAFEKAVEYEPKNLLSLRHLATAYYEAERWEDARRILRRVLKRAPEDKDSLYELGGVYLHLGNFSKAEQTLLKVIELDPDSAEAYSNLGLIYVKSGRLGDAAEAFNRAHEFGHPEIEGINSTLNSIQLTMLQVVASAYMEILNYGVPLDVNSLVAQVAKVRASIQAGKDASLDYPGTYFPNQLILVLSVLAEQLDEGVRYLLATKLLEVGLLPSDNASRLARRTIEVSRPDDASQDDERVEAMRAAASDKLFLADLVATMEDFQYADYDEQPA
jgi:tetratricopeptide (TPR) repeat protein